MLWHMKETDILYDTLMYGVRDVYNNIKPPDVINGRWSWMFPEYRAGKQHIQLSFAEPGDANTLPTNSQYLVVHGQIVIHGQLKYEDNVQPINIPIIVNNTVYPFGKGLLELIRQIRKSYVLDNKLTPRYDTDELGLTIPKSNEWVIFRLAKGRHILRGEVQISDNFQPKDHKSK
ncbi:hypothetical protein A3D77_00810 [Candidatus Gottesmanbacteria bacterium RIFCSPHIGHO2_02_FULL_39_11]|uniref:Uncharacterized protein n=1 Tax=Candidatus Gottesmanbacteria bacterium RIFCSPHIGHO2_02_FULL_39_11 TaxID=1798382 RepID=A0A1F5ZNX7_9BACT|nr:MAG: hypothetical protein A3D77_00810 [Candidatus Gottesmanbacteria bacterium RIFCSPHIGHO2_02_FULL_39_11]